MKILKTLIILGGFALLFASCDTTVDDPAGARGEAAVPGIQNLNPATYDLYDLENTFIQFDLTLEASGVDEAVLLVSYNKGGQRKEVTRVSSFPANIKVPLVDAVSVLGMELSDIEAADVFNYEVQTIQGGKTYFSSAAFNVAVVCGYEVENVTGDYTAFSEDWNLEGKVTLEADLGDPYKIYLVGLASADGQVEDGDPVTLIVDPLDYSVSAARATVASSAYGYTGLSFEGSGQLNTCDGTYVMMFAITVDQGSFGSFNFVFTKN